MQRETQYIKIKAHLQNGKKITPIDALNLYGCFRLSAIIFNLRQNGYPIKEDKEQKIFRICF